MVYTKVVNDLIASGANCYLFGGAVRDRILEQVPTDYDFLVGNINEDLFDKVLSKHGIIYRGNIIPELRKLNTGNGMVDFKYIGDKDVATYLKTNTDFTSNSLAYNMATDELLDFHGGRIDIANKVLRLTSRRNDLTSYPDFAIVPIRVARLSASLGFSIEPETFTFLKKHAHEMFEVTSKERRAVDLHKLFSRDNSRVALDILMKLEIFDRLFNEYDVKEL